MIMTPYGKFPYASGNARAVMLYRGSKQKELAKSFLGFLRSPDYNMSIVNSADSLPPFPKYMDTEEFLRPAKYTNEWKMHQAARDIANNNTFGREYSPFCLFVNYQTKETKVFQAFMNRIYTADVAVKQMNSDLNDEIRVFVKRHPYIQERYAKALEKQKLIDGYKARGEKIPVALIDNPFLREIYKKDGRAI
jgi:ABC-type glycerol-3-phosphate transport system substrate-binding protein